MAVRDRIRTTTTSTGSPFTLSTTAPAGHFAFDVFSNGDANIPVAIVQQDGSQWQVCYCTITSSGTTLTVNTVVMTSNNNQTAVTFNAGTKDVFVTPIASAVAMLRENNTFTGSNIFPNTGLRVQDTDASHSLIIAPGSNITADRTLTVTTGDANRTLTLNGNTTLTGTNTGDQTITLSGDVSGSGTGSISATIGNSAVSLVKMANLAANRVIGRITASTGVPEALTPDNIITVVNAASTNTINFARIAGAAASSHNQAWSTITSTPTTLSGYGITDAVLKSGDTLTGRLVQSSSGFGVATKDDISTRTDSGYFETNSATTAEGWPETTNNWFHLLASTHSNLANYYSMQFAGDFNDPAKIYYRVTTNLGTAAWSRIWHSGNDGSGSGLDADLLDGLNSGSLLRSDTVTTWNGSAGGSFRITCPAGASGTAGGLINSLEIFQPTSNADATIALHVNLDFGCHFGLDGTTNDLFVGGWSFGAVKHKVWHAGNDGSGSGLDADTVDGVQASSFATISGSQTLTNKTLTSPTINGGTIQSRPQASSETTGTLTSASANKTIQATGGITINTGVFSAGDIIVIYAGAASRTLTQGTSVTMRLAGTATTGSRTIPARGLAMLFFVSGSEVIVGGSAIT